MTIPIFDDALMADPHGRYAELRGAGPVHETVTPDGESVWVITGYAEARIALADPRLSLNKANARTRGTYQSSMPPELDAHLLNLDPPDHTRLRKLVSKAFTPRRMASLRPRIEAMAEELLAAAPPGPDVDLMAVLANPLPMNVICELLGIPVGARRDFREWTNTLLSPAPGAAMDSRTAMRSMYGYLLEIIRAKREEPTDDLLTAMIQARDEHDSLTESELVSITFLILFAGYDNSVHLIGNTITALLLHPEQLKGVRDGALAIRDVVEESLRSDPPFPLSVRRFALEELTIAGTDVPAGGRVWISLISANSDEAQFPAPREFDPSRAPAHLAFGHGIHYCLGAPLARLEAEVAIETLLRRRPKLKMAASFEDMQWWPSFHKRGLQSLPISW
ncbi:cytochrome P450 family protein [Streptomyces goshikiensis]|uniref:cytochrome P450 family protein n=1 Tax=Streptomyces goshikiensis TaxID=1942 RepID=UPI003647C83B